MPASSSAAHDASLRSQTGADALTLILAGRLDARSVGDLWREADRALASESAPATVVDASQVDYCDGAGVGLLIELHRRHEREERAFEIRGLSSETERLLRLYDPEAFTAREAVRPARRPLFEEVGAATARIAADMRTQLTFIGSLTTALFAAARSPRRMRWKDILHVTEKAGVNALPIVALISLLMGLIMAFQAAVPMKQFGADIFVADLVALSMLRELGPLMTAIILTGRSGSAFAAEIGTMKVNEEIDALTTMGLEPVRFLVVSRVVAAVVTTPMLAMFANLCGLVGGALVFLSFGYPLVTYVNQIMGSVSVVDLAGGLVKAFLFGIIVAGVGCARGLQTGRGASAVGESATRAVVSGILLIVITDGVFSIIYYFLGI